MLNQHLHCCTSNRDFGFVIIGYSNLWLSCIVPDHLQFLNCMQCTRTSQQMHTNSLGILEARQCLLHNKTRQDKNRSTSSSSNLQYIRKSQINISFFSLLRNNFLSGIFPVESYTTPHLRRTSRLRENSIQRPPCLAQLSYLDNIYQ